MGFPIRGNVILSNNRSKIRLGDGLHQIPIIYIYIKRFFFLPSSWRQNHQSAMDSFPPFSSSGRKNILSDDTVMYSIYPSSSSFFTAGAVSVFQSIQTQILETISPYLQDYIWQHQPFHLSVFDPSISIPSCTICGTNVTLAHLHGSTKYGDNVEDEWFIVSLLVVISKKFPALSIRVSDNDGEFILIESAYCLPRWINPDNSENRVFLRSGEICVLGRRLFPVDKDVGLLEAIRALENGEKDTGVSDDVQRALERRIAGYPERANENMHRARVRVPLPVAQVLKYEPSLISFAVEGFYDRDIDSMKHAGKMDKFLTSAGGGVDMVQLSVRMSRAMYGQLVQQKFQAPRCYPMPSRDAGLVVLMEAEMGMKIACGFEMMYQVKRLAMEEGKGMVKGGAWDAFKEKLESSGYFRQLLPGSQEYERLMHQAEENYKTSDVFAHTRYLKFY